MKRILTGMFGILLLCSTGCAQKQSEKTTPAVQEQAVGYTVKQLPLAQTEGFTDSIAKDYRGSVTLIDFWATWCGPCRAAMKEIDAIKPELMKRGVKFVYVTGETSPENTWKEMLPQIDGDHYRLSKTQWSALCRELQMRGIPAYMLLDKEGKVAFQNITEGGYPGNETIKAEIEKALGK